MDEIYLMPCGCCGREIAVPVSAYADRGLFSWPCPTCPVGGVDLIHARRHGD